MLDNSLLYLSSSMLQVWAALLVYVILKKRDSLASLENEIYHLWQIARERWYHPLKAMVDPNPPTLIDRLSDFGLDDVTIRTADTSRDSFVRTILAIKQFQLIVKMNKAFSDLTGVRYVSAQEGQITLDAIAKKVETTQDQIILLGKKDSIRFPFFGIAGNLFFLMVLPFFRSELCKELALFILGMSNFLLVLVVLDAEGRHKKN